MIHIQLANKDHVAGIVQICRDAQWATYQHLYTKQYIEQIINEFYTEERVLKEVTDTDFAWGGWLVALDNGEVVGAGGGGMTDEHNAEIYVLYLNPNRRKEGIGTMLLDVITHQQRKLGAKKQWVSVAKGNQKGIPFYEAKGFTYHSIEESYEKSQQGETYKSLRYVRSL